MIVDADGDLWGTVRDAKRPGIYAYTPSGEEKAYIPTTIPTNVHFGRFCQVSCHQPWLTRIGLGIWPALTAGWMGCAA